jgi:hypothetical protein
MVLTENGRPMLVSSSGEIARFAETLEWGYRLAETDVGVNKSTPGGLWAAKGWKQFVEHMPKEKQASAAIFLENCRRLFGNLPEATRTTNLGSFDKWIFPVISNMAENDVIDQIVAVQPMPGPTSQIVYMDIVTSQRKGNIPAGTQVWRALAGAVDRYTDSDELITGEQTGNTNNAGAGSINLEYLPVRAGTVSITVGSETIVDDGNGVLTGSVSATGTINYATGAVTITGATGGIGILASYIYDSEGSKAVMGYELTLTSSPVKAKAYKLKTSWSAEADKNLQAMYNIKAENVLLTAITNALQYQKHRAVIADLRARAAAGVVTWNATPPTGVSYQAHKFSIIDAFETSSNFIFGATNMMRANWVILGLQAATVVATLPHFNPKGNQTEMQGITYIGDLGPLKCFSDPHYPNDEWLAGYKGDQFFRTVYVLAEYQKLYTTPDIQLADFMHSRGFATSFAKKCINPKGLVRGVVLNAPTTFGPIIG